MSLNKTSLNLAINYSPHNFYFTLSSLHFGQLIGIPMRCDSRPCIAFLLFFIKKRISFLKQQNETCKSLIYFQYFCVYELYIFMNNEFQRNYKDNYPDKLELKKENENLCKTLFVKVLIKGYHSISIPICHLKYFMLQMVLKFYVLLRQQQP